MSWATYGVQQALPATYVRQLILLKQLINTVDAVLALRSFHFILAGDHSFQRSFIRENPVGIARTEAGENGSVLVTAKRMGLEKKDWYSWLLEPGIANSDY